MSSYGMWLSTAGMKVNEHRQALLANNMANIDTAGFKHDLAVIQQRHVEARESGELEFSQPVFDGLSGGVNVRPTFHSFSQGAIQNTGRPLDIAIEGEGFFAVTDGEETRYTRDGRFVISPSGELVMSAGNGRWKVLSESGSPMSVDSSGDPAFLGSDGSLRQGDRVITSLGVYRPADLQELRKVGTNTFRADGEVEAIDARMVAQSTEASSFNVMQGLASMIEAQRAYQLNATMIRIQDELTGSAITTLGRVA